MSVWKVLFNNAIPTGKLFRNVVYAMVSNWYAKLSSFVEVQVQKQQQENEKIEATMKILRNI